LKQRAINTLAEYNSDMALITAPDSAPLIARTDLKAHRLCACEFVAACKPDHPLSKRKRIALPALERSYPVIQAAKKNDDIPHSCFFTTDNNVAKQMVLNGIGVGILPKASIQKEIEQCLFSSS